MEISAKSMCHSFSNLPLIKIKISKLLMVIEVSIVTKFQILNCKNNKKSLWCITPRTGPPRKPSTPYPPVLDPPEVLRLAGSLLQLPGRSADRCVMVQCNNTLHNIPCAHLTIIDQGLLPVVGQECPFSSATLAQFYLFEY